MAPPPPGGGPMKRGIQFWCGAGVFLAAAVAAAADGLPGVYVWHRGITPAVMEAARAAVAEGRELFALAGYFIDDDKIKNK